MECRVVYKLKADWIHHISHSFVDGNMHYMESTGRDNTQNRVEVEIHVDVMLL
jgi:hypothetical protein